MRSGIIYCFTNLTNDKKYIGKTIQNFDHYVKKHLNSAINNNDNNKKPLYRAIRKYGIENFTCIILWKGNERYLNFKEKYFIKYYNTALLEKNSWGYNLSLGGDGGWEYYVNKRRIGKTQDEIYGKEKSKNISKKRADSLKINWENTWKRRYKTNNFIVNNPMNYINFKGENNPNYGKKHPKINSKVWLLFDNDGNEKIVTGIRPYFKDYSSFRVQTLIKWSKNNKFYKGFWCKEIKDCLSLYEVNVKSRYYQGV